MIVTLEGFLGLVFVSVSGAIIFVRLSRIQSFAQVCFSDAVVSEDCCSAQAALTGLVLCSPSRQIYIYDRLSGMAPALLLFMKLTTNLMEVPIQQLIRT